MSDREYLEKKILGQNKKLKATFEAQRIQLELGNNVMAQLRAKEQLEIRNNIKKLQEKLDALKD